MSIQERIGEGFPAPLPTDALSLAIKPAGTSLPWLQAALKRMLDLTVAVPALILLAPVLGLIAAAIRCETRGPAVFRQTRLGKGGRAFRIAKFRTMTVQEDGHDVVQARKNDPRVTKLGAFLRRTSLDELPQLINVIRGEMSLVGPRPHAWSHDELYSTLIPNYTLRQLVKPGMTGWAQVNGHRGETATLDAMRQRIEYDIWYASNSNILLDLKILWQTPAEVLNQRNAH